MAEPEKKEVAAAMFNMHMATRLADLSPATYDSKSRSVEAVISRGSPVKRFYGTETLRIHPDAVNLQRMKQGGIPVLDSHNQYSISAALGRVARTWFDKGALLGQLVFNDTDEGRKAEGMVSRGEIGGISAGYRVDEWKITDKDGNIIDPETDRIRWDDDLSFEAVRWEVYEASLCSVPADASASIRTMDLPFPTSSIFKNDKTGDDELSLLRARALARQRIITARLRR